MLKTSYSPDGTGAYYATVCADEGLIERLVVWAGGVCRERFITVPRSGIESIFPGGILSMLTFNNVLGKTILVGITYLDSQGDLIEQIQFSGTIIRADEHSGIVIKKANVNETFALPPDINSISVATPGEYRLRSTGEIVVNPDLLTTWVIDKP